MNTKRGDVGQVTAHMDFVRSKDNTTNNKDRKGNPGKKLKRREANTMSRRYGQQVKM